MDKYPLHLYVPDSQTARNALRFRHTTYLIVVDDCGKIYRRHRRYTNFTWLHGELRRRELPCALPELPPKRAFGHMDASFVERRRVQLEEYLKSLLHLPAVIQDDTLWAFLDADLATAVVPRFLCRPHSQSAAAECLAQLDRVVQREGNLFRLCSAPVLVEFVLFAKAEATADDDRSHRGSSNAPTEVRSSAITHTPGAQMRLTNRVNFCKVLKPLIAHERARQGLVECGMFGALLALLSRTTEEMEVKCLKGHYLERQVCAAQEDALLCDACQSDITKDHLRASCLACGYHQCAECHVKAISDTPDIYKTICFSVTDCLQRLMEASDGVALLQFCQQDGGLEALRRLADKQPSGTVSASLQQVCASLLWHGLKNAGVVSALVGPHARGVELMAMLYKSTDICARVLSALCICCFLRHEGALDAFERSQCLEALLNKWPEELDLAEEAAVEKTATAALERAADRAVTLNDRSMGAFTCIAGNPARSLPDNHSESEALGGEAAASGTASALRSPALAALPLHVNRDPQLVELLQSLCGPKELPRLHALFGDASADLQPDGLPVMMVIAVILERFVHMFSEGTGKLYDLHHLRLLAPQLQRIVEADDECWMVDSPEGEQESTRKAPLLDCHAVTFAEMRQEYARQGQYLSDEELLEHWADIHPAVQVRKRAARILIRLDWSGRAEGQASGEPPPLATFAKRARILEVLTRSSATDQEMAQTHLAKARDRGQSQNQQVLDGGLTEALCVSEQRLEEFALEAADLEAKRGELNLEVVNSQQAIDAMLASLDRRGVKRGIIGNDVDELRTLITDQSEQETRTLDAQTEATQNEAHCRSVASQVDAALEHLRQAEANALSSENCKHSWESSIGELQRREAELFEIVNTAPVKLGQVQSHLAELQNRRSSLDDSGRQLSARAEQNERWAADLQDEERQAQDALRGISEVQGELQVFQARLNSETILTDPELDCLRQYDSQLQPSRPARLRRKAPPIDDNTVDNDGFVRVNLSSQSSSGTADGSRDENRAPSWTAMSDEKSFRSSPNFRSFSSMVQERKQLWEREIEWLKEEMVRARQTAEDVARLKKSKDHQEQQLNEEEASLRSEAAALSDFDGHHQRHFEARDAVREARENHERSSTDVSEAQAALENAQVALDQGEIERREADAALVASRLNAQREVATALRIRNELQAHTSELETRCREYLHEWRAVELEEQRLRLLQDNVGMRLVREGQGRQQLRDEVHLLITQLQQLDEQLDVPTAQPIASSQEVYETNQAMPDHAMPEQVRHSVDRRHSADW